MNLEKVNESQDKDLHILNDINSSYVDNKLFVTHRQNITINKKKQFMLCNSCFWCASSYIHIDNIFIKKCPVCQNRIIEFLPISNNEIYKFNHNLRRGITLEFTPYQRICETKE
jgi:hypothetical protein